GSADAASNYCIGASALFLLTVGRESYMRASRDAAALAGVVGAEGLAARVDGTGVTGTLGHPGVGDGGEAARVADGVAEQQGFSGATREGNNQTTTRVGRR
ncbi:unnamed protein product, partial [Ectocarpus sp. 12 AP-2014]